MTCADFSKLGKIPFSKELLSIAETGIEISFLSFFRTDVGMLLGRVLLFELSLYQVRYFFGRYWWHKERFYIWVFKVIRKIPLCWWHVFLESFAYWCKVIIKMFCNIFWLTCSSAVYEKTIQFPCIDFLFPIITSLIPFQTALPFLMLSSKYFL